MKVYLFFNVFTTPAGSGYGHVRVSVPRLTHDVVKQVEKQVRDQEGYLSFTVTNIVQIDA